MSENVPDEERLASIIDFGNQSVLVPGNVEYHIGPHPVCTPKNLLQLRKALPRAASRNAIPMVESGACVGTCRLELSNRLMADDVHAPLIHVPITGTVSQPLSAMPCSPVCYEVSSLCAVRVLEPVRRVSPLGFAK